MRLLRVFIAGATIALLAVTPPANQNIDYSTLDANQGGGTPNFTFVAASPPPSNELIDYSHYKTYVKNQTLTCTVPGLNNNYVMTWNDVISCALTHAASQQSETISGNYRTITYTATFNSHTGLYVCNGPFGSDTYSGTPITLPAGIVAPSSSTPLSITLTSITFPGTSTSITVQLKDPSGSVRFTVTNATETTYTYTGAGAAGSWSWVITQVGGSDGACDPDNGVTNFGGTQMTFSGSVSWFQ